MTATGLREGGCLCGAVRYRVSGNPLYSVICHCVSCRRACGAPSVAWLTFLRPRLEFFAGEPRLHRSSVHVVRGFCGACGSQLTYATAAEPDSIDITTASLDDPTAFPPTGEVWVSDKLTWMSVDGTRGLYPEGTVGGQYRAHGE